MNLQVNVTLHFITTLRVTEANRGKCLLEQDRLQRRIQSFSDVFQQDWGSNADRVFERAQEVSVGHLDHFETVHGLAVPNPTISLSHTSQQQNDVERVR